MENRTKTILIVDDDKDFGQSVEELLTSEGYQVLRAYNGQEGLELALQKRPDLMILDVMMAHDTEGFEVSREIPKRPELKDMPVIMVTGITSEKNLPFKFEPDETWLPVATFLEKPVNPERLLKEIKARLTK
jgi:two-component system alkaline phosphatase synthesis response regulator PhoP